MISANHQGCPMSHPRTSSVNQPPTSSRSQGHASSVSDCQATLAMAKPRINQRVTFNTGSSDPSSSNNVPPSLP